MLNDRFGKPEKLNLIKSDLVYQLSSFVEKASTKLAISEVATEFPTLCLRMKKPAKRLISMQSPHLYLASAKGYKNQ